MLSRFIPLRITPIISAPTSALPTLPAAAEEAGATDDHRRDRVELGEVAEGRGPRVEPARGDDGGDAGQQPAQHVDRDEHRRTGMPVRRAPSGLPPTA